MSKLATAEPRSLPDQETSRLFVDAIDGSGVIALGGRELSMVFVTVWVRMGTLTSKTMLAWLTIRASEPSAGFGFTT